jgi:hypothetical protein
MFMIAIRALGVEPVFSVHALTATTLNCPGARETLGFSLAIADFWRFEPSLVPRITPLCAPSMSFLRLRMAPHMSLCCFQCGVWHSRVQYTTPWQAAHFRFAPSDLQWAQTP